MQIPVLSGMFTDMEGDYRISLPVNMMPIAKENGISGGYIRPAPGLVTYLTGADKDSGGVVWNNMLYRVMGSKLVAVYSDGTYANVGTVNSDSISRLDYSFDYLSVSSGGSLYLYDGTTVTQVTDPDLGNVVDHIWVDGYFMTTDGSYLVVTELNNPFAVNPLKYGSSEVNPDPIKALLKLRNEPLAVNRYTIEAFENIGGSLFPFQRIDGAMITRGSVGTHSCCIFADLIAFVGGGVNEPLGVWLGTNGQSKKISTADIDNIINGYTESEQMAIQCESVTLDGRSLLYVHLPDQTLVYDKTSSEAFSFPVWIRLVTAVNGFGVYRARNHVFAYGKWIAGDPSSSKLCELDNSISSHYNAVNGWELSTGIVYNESRGAVFHELELIVLTGRYNENGAVWTSYSKDGLTWSAEKIRTVGNIGDYSRRIVWFQQGVMNQYRIQKFRGTSDAFISVSRLEAKIEPLNV